MLATVKTARTMSTRTCALLMGLLAGRVVSAPGAPGRGTPSSTAGVGQNLALGRPYTFSQPPNYRKCGGPSDSTDLTDGTHTQGDPGAFWVTDTSVGWGWLHTRHVSITVDLGNVEPIQGVSYSTAGGWGGVSWPVMIDLQVSDEGDTFYSAGDLVHLTPGTIPDPADAWLVRRFTYKTAALRTRGRYVRLVVVPSSRFVVCDEIEIHRGPEAFRALSPGRQTEERIDPDRMVRLGCAYRVRLDRQRVAKAVAETSMPGPARDRALQRLSPRPDSLSFPADIATFRAIVPFNEPHREVFRLYAEVLRAEGVPELLVWQSDPYARLDLFGKPAQTEVELDVKMMRNEFRSAAFSITNASPGVRRLRLHFEGLPGGATPTYVRLHQVEFVDTRDAVVVASALVPLRSEEGHYAVDVPSGMTRQVWLSFHSRGVPAGEYRGHLVIAGAGPVARVPVSFSVAPVRFPDETDLFFSMWDYAFEPNPHIAREITPDNRHAAVRDMKEHLVNVPYSMKMPWPSAGAFDSDGNLVGEVDYGEFDDWVRAWPDAKCYAIFARVWPGVGNKLGGIRPGQPAFPRAVSQWSAAWARHNRDLGLRPGQVGVLFVDEPHTPEQYARTLQWTEPFRAGTSEIRAFATATMSVERDEEQIAALRHCDTIWTKRWAFTNNTEAYWGIYREFQEQGKDIWFYMCEGPVRQFDPAYYRLQPWQCLRAGAVGSGFWAYCDGGGERSWCPYSAWRKKSNFTPVYLGRNTVTTSKHWEAAREGVEDHQYVVMLRRVISALREQGVDSPPVRRAADLAESLPDQVVARLDERGVLIAHKEWGDQVPSRAAEEARLQVLEALVQLSEMLAEP